MDAVPRQKIALRTAVFLFFTAVLIVIQSCAVLAQISPEATVYLDRAVLAYEAKQFDEALKELEEALRHDPKSVKALYYQGLVLAALNRPADARAALEKARKLRPGDIEIAFQLGILYFTQKEYEKAEPLLQQAYQATPKRPNIGYYLGFMEYRKKNYRKALDFFQAAVPSDDNFAQLTRFYAGLAMGALGFLKQASAEIERALRLRPESPLTEPTRRFGEFLVKKAKEERFFFGKLRLGVFFDTNVPAVPSANSDIVARAIRQGQERRKSEGELVSLDLSYTWLKTSPKHPMGEWEGTISYRFFHNYNNHLTEFNTQSHTPTIAIVKQGALPSRLGKLPYFAGFQYTYDFLTLGNAKYNQRWILNPYFGLVEKPFKVPIGARKEDVIEIGNLTNITFRFQVKDFFNDTEVVRSERQDAYNFMIGPLHLFLFEKGRHLVKLGYQYDFENAEGQNWTYWGSRATAGAQYTLPWGDMRLRYDLDYYWRYHKHRHSLIPATGPGTKRRRDREATHFVNIAKDFSTDFSRSLPLVSCDVTRDKPDRCPFTVSVDYLFDDNKSNLAPFNYRRHVVTTSLRWRF